MAKERQHDYIRNKGYRQNFHVQFLTSPSADTPGQTAVLHFDDQRYMFGHLSEGTQRACIERGISIKKLNNVFITGHTTWEVNGGLIGLILSRADIQADELDEITGKRTKMVLYGGPKLLHSVACARRFVFRTGMPLMIHESQAESKYSAEPSFVDDNIRVWPIALSAHPVTESDSVRSQSMINGVRKESDGAGTPSHPLSIEEDQAARSRIIQDMFDSEWRRDRLIETKFEDVKMPATIWVRNPTTKELEAFHCAAMEDIPYLRPEHLVQVRNPWPASLVGDLPSASNLPSKISMSYIVRGHPQRGSFDAKKAIALGVKPGPLFRELTQGKSVTLQDKSVVHSDQVMEPSRPGKGVAFLDVPSPAYLNDLTGLLAEQPNLLEDVVAIVWMLGPGVSSTDAWKPLLESLGDVQHFLADSDQPRNDITFESIALSNARLAQIAPRHFPALDHGSKIQSDALEQSVGSQFPQPGVRVSIQPRYSIDKTDAVPPIDPVETVQELSLPSAQPPDGETPIDRGPLFNSKENQSPEIVTLGTGSALPSKYRNVSSTLLRMPNGQGSYLFDCGENSLGQLKRMYGRDECDNILRDIRAIWVSHLHADHHLGTISVLQERARAFDRLNDSTADRAIYLMSEANMIDFVREYATVEPSLVRTSGLIPLVSSQDDGLTLDGRPFNINLTSQAIKMVQSCRVSHCWGAQAVTFTFKSGFKISYSGDCRPSRQFCKIGQKSDVLIHEATFDDDMEGDALAKKHCTTSEALGVALNMRAKNVVLTHFSQRYSKIPNLENVKLPDEIKFEEVKNGPAVGPIDNETSQTPPRLPSPAPSNTSSEPQPPTEELMSDLVSSDSEDMSEVYSTGQQISQAEQRWRKADHRQRLIAKAAKGMHVCVAFDYMRVRVSEIKDMKNYYPAIERMFADQERRRDDERKARTEEQNVKVKERDERKRKNAEKARKHQSAASEQRRQEKGENNVATKKGNREADEMTQRATEKKSSNLGSRPDLLPTTLDHGSQEDDTEVSDVQTQTAGTDSRPRHASVQTTPLKRPPSPTTEILHSNAVPRHREWSADQAR